METKIIPHSKGERKEKYLLTKVEWDTATMEPISQVLDNVRKKYEETKMELEIAEKNREIRIMQQRINNLNRGDLDNSVNFTY